ncbi:MAG TPA: helix-turn-helix transcriptional regulator [Candidatus Limnocylindrales bacterium]
MSARDDPRDAGLRDARDLLASAVRELRGARLRAGLSQASVGKDAGLSRSAYGRLERGGLAHVPLEYLAKSARALGLVVSLRLYPAGSPVRDAAQLRLEADFRAVLGPGVGFRAEVPLPIEGDLRAWDGLVSGADGLAFAECVMHLSDMQELARRLALKLRDDPRSGLLILVVRGTRHNRQVLAEHREILRPLLPLDGAAVIRRLRAGRLPPASGLLVI